MNGIFTIFTNESIECLISQKNWVKIMLCLLKNFDLCHLVAYNHWRCWVKYKYWFIWQPTGKPPACNPCTCNGANAETRWWTKEECCVSGMFPPCPSLDISEWFVTIMYSHTFWWQAKPTVQQLYVFQPKSTIMKTYFKAQLHFVSFMKKLGRYLFIWPSCIRGSPQWMTI